MATLEQLEKALRNAHKAGDTNAAKTLANEILKLRSAPSVDPAQFPRMASGMTHEQKVEAYRATKPGDPWGDYLAADIQRPRQGETAAQAKLRAEGTGSTDRVDMSGTGKAAATFLQGVPFVGEYMDEGLGWMAGKMGLQSEEDATAAIRAGQADMDQNYPKTATGLRVSGGVTGGMVGAGAAPWWAPQSLGMRSIYGALTGGLLGTGEGAVSGYGSGTDDESRVDNAKTRAIVGGLLGTAIGGAAPFIAEGAARGGRWALDQLNVARQARQARLSRPSYEILTRAMDSDGSLQGQGAQRIAAAGPEGMLADAGPNAETLLDVTMQRTGPAANTARDAIEGRAARAGAQARDALDNALGVPRGMDTMETGIRQGSAPARQAAYDAAYAAPINYADPAGQQLEAMLQRVPGDIINRANRLMQIEGQQSNQILARIAPDGSVTYTRLPDVRQLDYITRAINLAAESGDGAGALGGQTALGRAYQGLSREIRQTVRNLVPEYGVALDTAAEPIAARQALQFGERMLNPATSRDEVVNTLQGLSRAEQQQVRAGVRSFIDERIANVQRTITDEAEMREAIRAVKDLSSRAVREKMTALLGQQEANALFETIDQAARSLELRGNVAMNSKTFVRTDTARTIDEATTGGIGGAIRAGEPVTTTKKVVQSLLGGTEADNLARSDRVYSEIARALTARNPQQILRNLQQIARRNPQNAAIARTVGGLLGYPIFGPAAYQIGTQTLLGAGSGSNP
jgi:hypothetical protein